MSRRHSTISALLTGDYLSPPGGRLAGQRVVAVAYLIRHPDATLLFDTGFPFDSEFTVDEGGDRVVTFPRPVERELQTIGCAYRDLDMVANCHLHIDHAGGNFRLPRELPIFVQTTELAEAAAEKDPLVINALALDRQDYRAVDGDHQLLPGIRLVPTPGHTAGHRSLLVETAAGTAALLGQAMPSASDFAAAAYAVTLEADGRDPIPAYPAWLPGILDVAPQRVLFAHDLASWQPPVA